MIGPASARSLVLAMAAGALVTSCATAPSGPSPAPSPAVQAPTAPSSSSGYGSPVLAGRIETGDVKESSGLSASECQDVLWTLEDAGNEPVIFGMDTTGKHVGTWRVAGAQNVDWESIASYRDPGGRCSLVIGDIGDNDEARPEVTAYRVPEPTASAETAASTEKSPLQTEPAQALAFRYPTGPHNAETLLVGPQDGALYAVTKEETGPAAVFRVEPAFGASTAITAAKIADVTVPAQPEGRLTGGSISPDGRRVMLCDLNGGYELVLPDGVTDLNAAWQQRPVPVDLGDRPQGEGVSYGRDGRTLYASSEEKNAPLYLITRA